MDDVNKTRTQLIDELGRLRRRLAGVDTGAAAQAQGEGVGKTPQGETALILDSLLEHVIHEDRQMRILWANLAACESAGLTREQIVGQYCYELWPQRSDPCPDCPVTKAMESGTPQEVEKETPDGRAWFIRGYPVRDRTGEVVGGIEITLEITDRKHAQNALRESEERYRALVENADESIVVAQDGMLKFFNPKVVEMTGYSEEELASTPFPELIHPDDRERVLERYRARLQGEVPPEGPPFRVIDKEGRIKWAETHTAAITWEGRPATLNLLSDVTGRRLAEQESRQHTAQMEALRQVGMELTAQLELDTLLHSIVLRASELLEGTGGSLYLYRSEQEVLERVVSAGPHAPPVGTILQPGEGLSGKVWDSGQAIIVDDYLSWRGRATLEDGHPSLAAVAVPVRWGDEALGVLSVSAMKDSPRVFSSADAELLNLFATQAAIALRNARALAASEEQRRRAEALAQATTALTSTLELEPLLENVLTAAIQAIPAAEKGSVLLIDERSGELCIHTGVGYRDLRIRDVCFAPGDGYAGRSVQEGRPLLISDARAEEIRYNGELEEIRTLQSAIVAPLRYRDQIIGALALDNASRKGAFDDEDLHLLATFADHAAVAVENARLFSALQQQMDMLTSTQAQLIQSAKLAAVGELAAGVAHELNNPLTSVLGFAEILAGRLDLDHADRKDLEMIVAEAQRARGIVHNLLDFARQTKSQRWPDDINRLLQQTLSVVRYHLQTSGVSIEEDYSAAVGPVLIDEGQMKQVFLNLISNAVQAMPGGGTLRLQTTHTGDQVTVSVTDTGTGIPPENLGRIFDPFFSTRPSGTGLGLSVSLGIVHEHGGQITVQSEPGKGSTFTVWLPVAQRPGEDQGDGESLARTEARP